MELEPTETVRDNGNAPARPGRVSAQLAQVPVTDPPSHVVAQQRRPSSEVTESASSGNRPRRPKLPLAILEDIRSRRPRLPSRTTPGSQQERPNLTFIKELAATRKAAMNRQSSTFEETESPMMEESPYMAVSRALKVGNLVKTSKSVGNKSTPGHSRQRKFRLTNEGLEYFQNFSHGKVKRSYPLTAVEKVEYDNVQNPLLFKLVFSTYILSLQAESEEDARDWVEKINSAWSMWVSPGDDISPEIEDSSPEAPETILEDPEREEVEDEEGGAYSEISSPTKSMGMRYEEVISGREEMEEEQEAYCEVTPPPKRKESTICYDDDVTSSGEVIPAVEERKKKWVFQPASLPSVPPTPTGKVSIPSRFQRRWSPPVRSSSEGFLKREESEDQEPTYDSRKRRYSRRAFRIARLRPQLERQDKKVASDPDRDHDPAQDKLHREFSMIKYPSTIFRLPNERVFTVDRDNLQILWKKVSRSGYLSGFRQKSSLSLRRIVEVRRGQQTTQFDKFPYEDVEDLSFSLLFETEKKKYAKLSSLDVICDHKDSFYEWMEGLATLVSSSQWLSLFPPRYENSDPTILWLKMIWTCKSENRELKEKKAIKLVKKFIPQTAQEDAKIAVQLAHDYQVKHTFNYGAALRWDGFVLLFHLLCDTKDLQLYDIFGKYARQYPDLGLTVEEFRRFLIEECHWLPADTKPSVLHTLIKHHDTEHHQAIKKFCASNQPREFQIASKLISFAGLLSFLRSKDNSVINLEHEMVYQDMTQPLSHYFINSSHNTYLEGDQITGTSSTDAYVRTLLQGCRCIEIDCWDGLRIENGLSEKEAVIYHGYTLTTKVAFRDVIHAINDSGFSSSIYPIIISIENHCSAAQQSRMAKVFRAIFESRLPTENLCELEGRERLPSPEELQGKVILKGSYKKAGSRTVDRKTAKKLKKARAQSQAQLSNTGLSNTKSTAPTTSLPVLSSAVPSTSLPVVKPRSSTAFPNTSLPVDTKLRSPSAPVDTKQSPTASPNTKAPRSPFRPAPPIPEARSSSDTPLPVDTKPRSPSTASSSLNASLTPALTSSLSPSHINPELSLLPTSINPELSASGNHLNNLEVSTSNDRESSTNLSFRSSRKQKLEASEDLVDGGGHEPFRNLRINRRSVRRQGIQDRVAQHEQGHDDQELEFAETEDDLKKLIVYCRSVTIKPWDWKLQQETTVSEMFSFGEPTAVELCKKFKRDVLRCTERQLMRTYPKGTRFDSSNYDPFQMWNCGVQMVALNFQHPDVEMHLNQGFFRNNGGCGYVLKPLMMRQEDPGGPGYYKGGYYKGGGHYRKEIVAPYSPDMMVPHPSVTPVQLEVELLSGQRLCSWKKKCNFVSVDIQTYGIKHDCGKMKQACHNRAFWPSWKEGEHVLQKEIFMPEMCLLYIRVENEGKKIYGQNCFPISSLLPGIKFIPMRSNGGELIPESGIFVRIKKSEGDWRSQAANGISTSEEAGVGRGLPRSPGRRKAAPSPPGGGKGSPKSPDRLPRQRNLSAGQISEEGEQKFVQAEIHLDPDDLQTQSALSYL